jgi:hypothetical protein
MIRTSLLASLVSAILFAGLVAAPSANAQSGQSSGFGVGNIHKGLVVGTIVGVAAVVGVTVTYLALHNRGVVVGCITESGEKRTLVGSDRVVYLLSETGPKLPAGERAKLKGHKSGQPPSRSFQVEKVLKDYGRCPT